MRYRPPPQVEGLDREAVPALEKGQRVVPLEVKQDPLGFLQSGKRRVLLGTCPSTRGHTPCGTSAVRT